MAEAQGFCSWLVILLQGMCSRHQHNPKQHQTRQRQTISRASIVSFSGLQAKGPFSFFWNRLGLIRITLGGFTRFPPQKQGSESPASLKMEPQFLGRGSAFASQRLGRRRVAVGGPITGGGAQKVRVGVPLFDNDTHM